MTKPKKDGSAVGKSQTPIDVLIITALSVERDAVLQHLSGPEKIQFDGEPGTYHKSSLSASASDTPYSVVVTMLNQMGNVAASAHAAQAIRQFNPNYVLMVGIAGGIKGKVGFGDIVVSEQICYYEQSKETPSGSELRPQVYPSDPVLLDRAKNYENNNWHNLIKANRPDGSSSQVLPKVHFCPFAVGEKVVADEERANALRSHLHSKLLAIEMESFGVAFAAAQAANRPRFLAIRGISDHADHVKNDDWHEYAAASAAAFTIGFLRSGPVSPREAVKTGSSTIKTLLAIRHQSMEPLPPRAILNVLPPDLVNSDLKELVLNQTDLYVDNCLTDPWDAVQRQIVLTQELTRLLEIHPNADIAYYGIAHIPLLFLMGSQLVHRRPLHLFEHNRQTHRWDLLQIGGRYPKVKLNGLPSRVEQREGDVVVRISISYPVYTEAIEGIVPDPIASLHLTIAQPRLDVVTSQAQIGEYSKVFRRMFDEIHNRLPNAKRLHVFYSGPVALAVSLGQNISKTIHPRIIVYNYVYKNRGYDWGLDIASDIHSPTSIVRLYN
jgi:nucleoside phosphorylase